MLPRSSEWLFMASALSETLSIIPEISLHAFAVTSAELAFSADIEDSDPIVPFSISQASLIPSTLFLMMSKFSFVRSMLSNRVDRDSEMWFPADHP